MVVPRASEPALHLYNPGSSAMSVAVVTTVVAIRTIVARIIPVIGIRIRIGKRIEEREAKGVDKDERVVVIVESVEAIVKEPSIIETVEPVAKESMRAHHVAWRKVRC